MPKLESLPVIFRIEPGVKASVRKGEGYHYVTAVFPTLPGTNDPHTFTVYAHLGQHGSGASRWYRETKAAKPAEFADLLAELRRIYETPPAGETPVRLEVRQRFTQAHDRARRAELARMDTAAQRMADASPNAC